LLNDGTGMLDLAVGDTVRLGVEKENGVGASTVTVNHGNLVLFMIGG